MMLALSGAGVGRLGGLVSHADLVEGAASL